MDFLKTIYEHITGFFGLGGLYTIIKSGDYGKLLTYDGITALLGPMLPVLLVFEIIRGAFYKKFKVIHYKISFWTYVLNAFIGSVLSIAMVGFCIGFFRGLLFSKPRLPGTGLFTAI
ncbi:hypothetical protein ACQ86K_23670 [Mucilaginibacter sp. P19]|uniref:hypothetical protein n=1 Tax=Mucilaginibacter sp. P19 TaxID=3423947 RepID=UPI003D679C41